MILEAAAFLALAVRCGEGVPPAILAGINRTESAYNTLAININHNGKGQTVHGINTMEQAKAKIRELITRGENFDAGVMQMNYANWTALNLNVNNVFDACENIRAAAKLLQSYSLYNTGTKHKGFSNGYAVRTWNNTQAVSRETPNVVPINKNSCPLPKPPEWAVWGQVNYAARCKSLRIVSAQKAG